MTTSIAETIKKLVDSETAKIDIPTLDGQMIRLNCIYKESLSPNFFLVFPPKKLPANINIKKYCPISIKSGKTALTLSAKIVAINGDRTLELTAQNAVKPETLRQYFRVSTKVSITAKFTAQTPDSRNSSWTLEGRTLDLSGSGVLAIFPSEPQTKHKITLSISLSDDKDDIECMGHVVRIKRLRKGRFQVSFHFDQISPKDNDSIISFCLQVQRNQLREQIQTTD